MGVIMSRDNPDNSGRAPLDLADEGLPRTVERLSIEALNALPFGVIRLDPTGRVTFFSRTESKQSGFGDRNALGRNFFTDLAPCMGSDAFQRRIDQALAAGTLDLTFEQIGDFDDAERELRVRVASATGGGQWVFIQRMS
jgi:photoactive yellow protein